MTHDMPQLVAWALVQFLWQGTLVACLLAAILGVLRDAGPTRRYALSCAALLVMLALPPLTAWRLREQGLPPRATTPAATAPIAPITEITAPRLAAGALAQPAAPAASPLPTTQPAPHRRTAAPVPAYQAAFRRIQPLLPWIFDFWLAGVAVLSLYHSAGGWQVKRLARRATSPVPRRWQVRLDRLRQQLGVKRQVELLQSGLVRVPAVLGWLRPVILVPASVLFGLPPHQLESVLAHELAHVRRHDYLVNLLQVLIETLFFFHPAVFWVSHQIRVEREHCCDDLAVAACGDRLLYARALVEIESLRAPAASAGALALAVDGGSLLARIRRLAERPARRDPQSGLRLSLAGVLAPAALLACCLVPFAARSGYAAATTSAVSRLLTAARPVLAGAHPTAAAGARRAVLPASASESSLSPATAHNAAPPSEATAMPMAMQPQAEGEGAAEGAQTGAAQSAAAQTADLNGRWTGDWTSGQGRLQLTALAPSGDVKWNSTLAGPLPEPAGAASGPALTFRVQREAGTFYAEGQTGAPGAARGASASAAGTFRFVADPGFVAEMEREGYPGLTPLAASELAVHDVTLSFVRELAQLGYEHLPLPRLIELRVHEIDPQYIRDLAAAGYSGLSAKRLVELRVHGVTPAFIHEMAARGYTNLSAAELVRLRLDGQR